MSFFEIMSFLSVFYVHIIRFVANARSLHADEEAAVGFRSQADDISFEDSLIRKIEETSESS